MATTKEIRRLIELRAQNISFDKIASELGKTKQTLIDWAREYQEEIANLKALELESLRDEFFLSKEATIRRLSKLRTKVEKELEGRDLSTVQTDKLFEIHLKLENQIKAEDIEPKFYDSNEISKNQFHRSFGIQ